MSTTSITSDVFVAFHEADVVWVHGLVAFLRAHHITVSSELDFAVGDSRVAAISHAIDCAKHLVQVISPEAMADPWVNATKDATLARALEIGKQRPVLPVVIRSAPRPPLLKVLVECRLTAREEPRYREGLSRLLKAIREFLQAIRDRSGLLCHRITQITRIRPESYKVFLNSSNLGDVLTDLTVKRSSDSPQGRTAQAPSLSSS